MHINSISRYSSDSISSHSPRLAFEPSHDLVRYFISSAGSVQFRFPMPSGHQTWSKPSDHRITATCTTRYRQQLHSVPQEPSPNERNTNGRIIVYTDDRTTHRPEIDCPPIYLSYSTSTAWTAITLTGTAHRFHRNLNFYRRKLNHRLFSSLCPHMVCRRRIITNWPNWTTSYQRLAPRAASTTRKTSN